MTEPTAFDELFVKLTPSRLLGDPRATGEGVRVAVIDSGIERSILEERFQQRGIAIHPIQGAIFDRHDIPPKDYVGHQSSPHGTTVAEIILSIAPRVQLFSADIFGSLGSSDVETVIATIRYAMDHWNVKVINLSLGIPEHKLQPSSRRLALHRAIEEAYYRDVIVFAAANNDHPITRSYPATFAPPLISVDKGIFDDPLRFAYALREQVEFQARSKGNFGPFAQEPATSWATPHLAGIAARLLTLKPDMKPFEMKTILYWLSRA